MVLEQRKYYYIGIAVMVIGLIGIFYSVSTFALGYNNIFGLAFLTNIKFLKGFMMCLIALFIIAFFGGLSLQYPDTTRRMIGQWDLQILVIPFIIYIFIFMYIPMYGMLMAFQQFKLGDFPGFSEWAGLRYFIELFKDPNFPRVFRNTVAMSTLRIIFGFPMPIIFAIMLNEIRMVTFKKFTQTISYLPHFISWVVAATLMFDFFSDDNGAINTFLVNIGLIKEPIFFFGRAKYFWGLATVTDIWKTLGWNAIIYVAAITSIDSEQYEAASIDGASRLAKIWHITIAGIMPTIIILFILAMGTLLASNFDQVWMLSRQMTNSLLRETADVLDTYVLRVGIREFRYSYAQAVGVFRTVVNFSLVLIANFVSNKVTGRGLF